MSWDLLLQEGPRLEAIYMETIGQLQYEELCLQYDIALLKLERDLLQSFLNRGEEPDVDIVTEQVEKTAQTYNENIHRQEEKIKQAKTYIEEHKEENTKDKDAEKLIDLFAKAGENLRKAETGDADAQAEVANLMMYLGRSVTVPGIDSEDEFRDAVKWAQKAADQDNVRQIISLVLKDRHLYLSIINTSPFIWSY